MLYRCYTGFFGTSKICSNNIHDYSAYMHI